MGGNGMREILFRGKRIDNDEWVYGYIYEHQPPLVAIAPKDYVPEQSKWYICNTAFADWNMPRQVELVEVDPSTIGQYSGFTDKNGTRIFEGDIIKLVTADFEKITITCEYGTVRRQIYENEVEITGFYFIRSNDRRKTFPITHNYLGKHDTEIWEVVGNIHDGKSIPQNNGM